MNPGQVTRFPKADFPKVVVLRLLCTHTDLFTKQASRRSTMDRSTRGTKGIFAPTFFGEDQPPVSTDWKIIFGWP